MPGSAHAATPYEVLALYEQRSLAHAVGKASERVEAAGLWRGIGFRLGDRHFVSPISEVNEILAPPPLTPVPGAKTWLLGIGSVRGNLVPVVDLRSFAEGSRASSAGDTPRVLMVRQPGGAVGLLVDEVLGQRNFSEDQMVSAGSKNDGPYAPYVAQRVELGDTVWDVFSMNALVRNPQFQHAAA